MTYRLALFQEYVIKDTELHQNMLVKNITVLGSGVMGHGIAQVSATAGYNVVLRDIKQEFLDKAMEKIKWSLDKLVSKEKISKEKADSIFSRITPIVDLKEAVKNAEMIIEVVPEIMELKKKVYAELGCSCRARCNICIKHKHIANYRNSKYDITSRKVHRNSFFQPPTINEIS